jgi:rRNA small subunit pseudouridine methyltransferase Nep1
MLQTREGTVDPVKEAERGANTRLIVILAEAGLETIPRELWGHPSVYLYARKRGKPPRQLLLDASQHHQALRGLAGREYRGRPDIAHLTLLTVLDSPLCRRSLCEVIVAATGGVIRVEPQTRLPRNYLRFTGLIEQLFEYGQVPPGTDKPLLRLTRESLESLLAEYKPLPVFTPSEAETKLNLLDVARKAVEKKAVLIPTTPRSKPTLRLLNLLDRTGLQPVAVNGVEEAEPWTLASRLLCAVETVLGIT